MASTGLSSQNSAMPASRAIARLVPTCRIASTSGPSTSRIASPSSRSETCAIATGPGAAETLEPHQLETAVGEEAAHLGVADRLIFMPQGLLGFARRWLNR